MPRPPRDRQATGDPGADRCRGWRSPPARSARLHGERDPAALARRLAGDLDAIARKAVASRPECRYPSMREFADDLRRWLQLRPVHAQRSGGRFAAGLYRACTFLRRHRSAAALAAPLLLALALAAGAWSWQQHRRAEEARAAEAVGQLFASTLGTATLAGLGSAPFSSERLLQHTEAQLRELRLHRHPALYARSLATLARSRAVIGDYDRAQALAEQARQALGETVDESGYVAATRLSLLNTMARYAQAAALARQSLRRPHRREDADERAALMAQLATAQWGMGEVYPALDTLGAALSQVRALGPAHDELQAQMLIQRSGLRAQLYRYPGADDDARRAIALAEGRNPILADDGRQQLLDVLLTRGGQVDVAIAERLLAGRRRSLGERHPKTGMAWIMLGSAEYAGGRIVSAKARNATGRELILAAYGRDHPAYARALTLQSYIDSRDSRDNLAALREALAIYRRTLGPAHDSTLGAKQRLAARLSDLPHAQQRSGDFAEIVALHRDNLRLKRRANLPTPWEDLYLGRAWMRSGGRAGLARAEPLLRSSRLQAQRYFAREDRYSLLAQDTWASFLYLNGDKARAAGEFARILERQLDRRSYVSVVLVHSALLHRAAYALENCDRRQAGELLERAYAYDLRRMGAANFLTQDARTYLDSLRRRGVLLNQDRSSLLHPALAATNAAARRCPRRAPAASAHRPR
ncbi:hypothetical protein PRJ39_13820 [Lysobacter enzymogenes]|uniref:hypothetical protein n=1 Tax=Lysobacter enzymogenes TaxID=69 RepID=UPI0037490DD5